MPQEFLGAGWKQTGREWYVIAHNHCSKGKGLGALRAQTEGEIGAELCRLGDADQAEKGRRNENNMSKDTRRKQVGASP